MKGEIFAELQLQNPKAEGGFGGEKIPSNRLTLPGQKA